MLCLIYTYLLCMLMYLIFLQFTIDRVKNLVDNCPKQRFALKEEGGVLFIRANQGHSIEVCIDINFQNILHILPF